jgi:tetratricopeptide (TPR) repeat protein
MKRTRVAIMGLFLVQTEIPGKVTYELSMNLRSARFTISRLAASALLVMLMLGSREVVAQTCMPGGPCISVPRPTGNTGGGNSGNSGNGGGGNSDSSSSGNSRKQSRQPSAKDIAIEAYNAGNQAYKNGDYENALNYFLKAGATLHHDRDTRCLVAQTRGVIAYKNGDYRAALSYYQQAAEINHKNRSLRTAIAYLKKQIDDENRAAREQALASQRSAQERIAVAQREQERRLAAEREKIAENLARAQREQEQHQQDKIAADNIQQATQNFAQSLQAIPSDSARGQLFNSGKETTGLLFDNGRAHDDAVVDATLPNVETPSAQGTPLDARLAQDKDYQAAVIDLTRARAEADALNRKMTDLQDQQKASPTQERQIEISNLSAQTNQANGAVVIATEHAAIVQKIIRTFTVLPAAGTQETPVTTHPPKPGAQSIPAPDPK